MFGNSQTQNAGDNSQQVQGNNISIYNLGITEQRAREIFNEQYALLRREMTEEALACATERIKLFEERLLARISEIEGALNMFADPSYQFLLVSAQKSAAASERITDYDMLAELLACRIEKATSRKNRVGIGGAVEVIYNVDDDALCALTACYFLTSFVPVASLCKDGVQVLAKTFDKLLYTELPSGDNWLDHLDILKAIRLNTFNNFKKFEDWYPNKLNGYTALGIRKDSVNYLKSLELLESINAAPSVFIPNEFLADYVKLPVASSYQINSFYLQRYSDNGTVLGSRIALNKQQIKVLEDICHLYDTDIEKKKMIKTAFLNEWDKYPSLKRIRDFYNRIPYSFTVTQIGKILAYTNAKRCDNNIPDLPLE